MSVQDGFDFYQEIHSILKIYPDRVRLFRYEKSSSFQRFDLAERKPKRERMSHVVDPDAEKQSLRRAKTKVMDIALCNDFELMVTFTFSPKKVDRFNDEVVKRCLYNWVNHQRSQYGKFNYVLMPERHKTGALHFHGIFGNYQGPLKSSGVMQGGRMVYNLTSYQSGFTTAVYMDNKEKAVNYVTKYITKEMPQFRGKQRYWCSNGLKRPLIILNPSESILSEYEFIAAENDKHILEFSGQMADIDIVRLANFNRPSYEDINAVSR